LDDIAVLKRILARERAARKQAENILEKKSAELYESNLEKEESKKKLEALVKIQNSKLKGFFENIIDPYIMIDLSGHVLKMNTAAEILLGHKVKDSGVLRLKNITSLQNLNRLSTFFKELNQVGRVSDFEIKFQIKPNINKLININCSVVYNQHKIPIAAHGIFRDVTELKKLELQKEQLLKELKKSNENLQEYAHVVSHDLKSPLRSLEALTTWIKQDNIENLKPESVTHFNLIAKTLENMENLITAVLSYSSVGAQMDIQKNVNIHQVVQQVLQTMVVPNHIQIIVVNTLPLLNTDVVKMRQLFQNLITNAIKFNDKQTGVIKIDVEDIGKDYQFSITDNGIGIAEKYHSKIFEIFHSLKKAKNSSGIGLSMVKKIVELHQGKIWLESTVGIGTTFYFTIKK